MKCAKECELYSKSCKNESCKHWIDFAEDHNCSIISIERNGAMTLEEVSSRLKISLVMVKFLQDRALAKLKKIETAKQALKILEH